jgi:hypothetical protein
MMTAAHERIRPWLRGVGLGLLWSLCVLLAVVVISAVAMRLLGGVQGWDSWLDQHRIHLLVWRLALYAATLLGWCWMRQRLLRREPNGSTLARLRRTEFAAILVIVALECLTWLQAA